MLRLEGINPPSIGDGVFNTALRDRIERYSHRYRSKGRIERESVPRESCRALREVRGRVRFGLDAFAVWNLRLASVSVVEKVLLRQARKVLLR